MAHPSQMNFFESVKGIFPEHFDSVSVLDVGSLDINGCNKPLFTGCNYFGMDIATGKNVDVVCPVHLSGFPSDYFDTIISGECFEHDMHFEKSIKAILRMLKKHGLFVMTCAGKNRAEHGTLRSDPWSSPLTCKVPELAEFYQNREPIDFKEIEGFDQMRGIFSETREGKDLFYCGIKV